jgi:hypothetical protein
MSENRPKQGKRPPPRTAFKPGQSGNPGGRPKVAGHVRDLARERQVRAIEVLTKLMESKDERVQLAAANAMLDRGSGRPSSEAEMLSVRLRIEAALKDDLDRLSDEQLNAMAAGAPIPKQQWTNGGPPAIAHTNTDETETNEERD